LADNLSGGTRIGKHTRRKDLNWLNLIRVCQLNRQLLVELESLLETDEFLGKLLHSSEGNFAISKNLPRYLNCIEAGGNKVSS